MTRLISAPTESGQLRHYFIRESTLDGWRPQCGQWARLVETPVEETKPCPECTQAGGRMRAGSCGTCDRVGRVPKTDAAGVCRGCLGRGKVSVQLTAPVAYAEDCPVCKGTGRSGHPEQAAIGDIVLVTCTITPPGSADYLWLEHRGGSNLRCATLDTPRCEKLNHGTVGVWEHVDPIVLATWPDGTTLERLSGEDRVGVLVAAVRELSEEERRTLVEKILAPT